MDSKAIVAREPTNGPSWNLEDIIVGPPADDEVIVKITASGICHTDLTLASIPTGTRLGVAYPRIVGHEGAGIIQAIGKNVRSVVAGDRVLLSYYSCSDCAQCNVSLPSYCSQFNIENYAGRKGPAVVSKDNNEEILARFFGQSSFAEYAIAAEASVMKVNELLQSDDELSLFAPLGCGFQTGMGAVANVAKAGPNDVVMILGMGAVGMAALMTAKIRNSKIIIALDRFPSRLELAESLGATHTINTTVPEFDFQQAVRKISPPGASVIVDTTGVPKLIEEALASLSPLGKIVHIAPTPPGWKLSLDLTALFMTGKTITGCIEGNCIPSEAVPQMIQWYREGKFPIDKLITFFPALEFQDALDQLNNGSVLKPVLNWS
ncbi:chaperonin 10-like protein [Aspergillus varians]